MILIELIRKMFFYIARFFIWVTTARDCKHCRHATYKKYSFFDTILVCVKSENDWEECLDCPWRRHFERR